MDIKNRLAFSTLGCPNWSFAEIINNAKVMGFSAVEMRGVQNHLEIKEILAFHDSHKKKTEKLLEENNIYLCGMNLSSYFHDPEQWEKAVLEIKEAIDFCGERKIPFVRVFGNEIPQDESRENVTKRVVSGLLEVCRYAKEKGNVRVLLEVHGDFHSCGTLGPVLLGMKNVPAFGLIWDIEHSYRAMGNDWMDFYQMIQPFLYHVHIKDCTYREDIRTVCLPGQGDIDIEGIVHTLEKNGYRGLYSFEWEKRWIPELSEPEEAFPFFVEYMRAIPIHF